MSLAQKVMQKKAVRNVLYKKGCNATHVGAGDAAKGAVKDHAPLSVKLWRGGTAACCFFVSLSLSSLSLLSLSLAIEISISISLSLSLSVSVSVSVSLSLFPSLSTR